MNSINEVRIEHPGEAFCTGGIYSLLLLTVSSFEWKRPCSSLLYIITSSYYTDHIILAPSIRFSPFPEQHLGVPFGTASLLYLGFAGLLPITLSALQTTRSAKSENGAFFNYSGILNTWIGNGSVIYVYRKTIRDAPT